MINNSIFALSARDFKFYTANDTHFIISFEIHNKCLAAEEFGIDYVNLLSSVISATNTAKI